MELQQRNDPKRLLAVPTAIAMLLASIYPPFHSADNSSIGYFFLFSAPEYGSIDIGRLVDLTDILYHRHRETIASPPPDPEVVGQG